MFLLALMGLALMCYAGILFYLSGQWNELQECPLEELSDIPFLSIIIPARNEEGNIARLLEAIRRQKFPAEQYEVIVVDDFSEDRTVEIISTFPDVRCIKLADISGSQNINAYKKKALEVGIYEARGKWIVCTDADCNVGSEWLKSLSSYMTREEIVMVAGPVNYFHRHSLLNIFQELDFMMMQMMTGGILQAKKGNMANGANLAYRKKLFTELKGFENIDGIASGDDMMFMIKVRQKYPDGIVYAKCSRAIVTTAAAKTWIDFFQQRIRWGSKNRKLKDRYVTYLLTFIFLFNLGFILIPWIYPFPNGIILFFILWILKAGAEFLFSTHSAIFFDKAKITYWLFILQPVHALYIVLVGLLSQIKTYKWKGRRVYLV